MHRNTLYLTTALAALGALPAEARADSPIRIERPVAKNSEISIRNVAGSLEVVGWDKDMLFVEGTTDDRVERVEVSGDEGHTIVEVVLKKGSWGDRGEWGDWGDWGGRESGIANLKVNLPRTSRPSLRTVSASIDARDLAHTLEAKTVSGALTVTGRLQEVELKSVSGKIKMNGSAEKVRAKTVSGSIDLGGVSGDISVKSVSGDINVAAETISRANAKSVSGDVKISGDLKPDAAIQVKSQSGTIELRLPGSVRASADIRTFSGDVENAFGAVQAAPTSEPYRHHRMKKHYVIGGGEQGGVRLDVSTMSGDIKILKR